MRSYFFSIPTWAQQVIAPGSECESLSIRSLGIGVETTEMARLTSGFLIREMLERFIQKIDSTLMPDRSLWMYSAHGTTIAQILLSLGIFNVIRDVLFEFTLN